MRSIGIPVVLALCVVISTPAAAGMFGLGANVGFSAHNPEGGGDDTQILGWPGNVLGYQPGIRFSYTGEARTHEGFLDTGFYRLSGGGESASFTILSGNYQYNFATDERTRPFLTAGAGLYWMSFGSDFGGDEDDTTFLWGGGLGLRHWVSENHGAIRVEARYDLIEEGDTMIGAAGVFTFRLGFDMWM